MACPNSVEPPTYITIIPYFVNKPKELQQIRNIVTQAPIHIFCKSFLETIQQTPMYVNKLGSRHHWMRLVEGSGTKNSDPSEVPRFVGNF